MQALTNRNTMKLDRVKCLLHIFDEHSDKNTDDHA